MLTLRSILTGSGVPAEADQYKQLITLAQGGRLQRACEEGRLFVVANQAAVATTAALATTWTGLGVCNPAGSGKNFIFHEFGWSLSLAGPAAGVVGLMSADSTGMAAALTARNRKSGGPASVSYCDDGATIGTPVLEQVLGSYGTAATTAFQGLPLVPIDLKGSTFLVPGRSLLTYTTTACTAAFLFHFLWEEVKE